VLDRLPDQPGLCHYDFHPDQVLLTDQGPVIIDWMTACQGHPLADVARSAIIFTYFPLPPGNPLRRVLLDQGKKLFFRIYQNSYLRRYRTEHPQYTRQELDEWLIPVAAGRLREDIPGEREPILAFLRRSLAQ
jgi:aminoglycoside phosphotransferase (APT) family kinase protein